MGFPGGDAGSAVPAERPRAAEWSSVLHGSLPGWGAGRPILIPQDPAPGTCFVGPGCRPQSIPRSDEGFAWTHIRALSLHSQSWLPVVGTGGPEALGASSWPLHWFPHHPCSFPESVWECEFPMGSLFSELGVILEMTSFVTDRHFRRSPPSSYRFGDFLYALLAWLCPLLSHTFLSFLEGLGRKVSRVVRAGAFAN